MLPQPRQQRQVRHGVPRAPAARQDECPHLRLLFPPPVRMSVRIAASFFLNMWKGAFAPLARSLPLQYMARNGKIAALEKNFVHLFTEDEK